MAWARRPRSADYGGTWPTIRKRWAARHEPWHPCVRCGHPLGPMGPGLHLDHDDRDRSVIHGFAHGAPCPTCRVRCNLVAGARKGARIGNARQRAKRAGATTLRW